MNPTNIIADVGVVIGRFQVDRLHPGHIELLDWINQQHKKVIVVLGISAVPGLRENPLDFESRFQMIKEKYQQFLIVPISDTKTNEQWSTNLDRLIDKCITPSQSVILYGSRDSFISSYNGRYRTQELVGKKQDWTGTKIREGVKIQSLPSQDFRAGVIWQSYNAYPKIVSTVDIAIHNFESQFLLVKKPDENKWRFPGGFTSPNSLSNEEDALRETLEETNTKVVIEKYIGSININDWRYVGIDRIRTSFFLARYRSGDIDARDDVSDIKWINWMDMTDDVFVDTHIPLFHMLQAAYKMEPK